MKLSFLLKNLFVIIIFIFFYGSILAQQPPCVSAPTLYSTNVSNTPTTTICNSNPLTLFTSIPLVDCPQCTYQWSDGQTGPYAFAYTPGVYSVTITDNGSGGCVGITNSLNITSSTLNQPIISGDSFNVCIVGSTTTPALLEVANPCSGCSYQWYDSLGIIAGETNTRYPAATAESYYVRVVGPQGCIEYSEYIKVGERTVSVPPLYVSTTSICDTNTTVLSTIDCNGCTYEWYYYDFPPEQRLIISGVYTGDLTGGEPKGIEIYAVGNIPDLSIYNIGVLSNSNPGPGTPSGFVNLPTIALPSGSYYYIAHDRTSFTNFFSFPPDTILPTITNLSGIDQVTLRYDTTITDVFGNTTGPIGWHHGNGWCYRSNNQLPNAGTFDETNWDKEPNALTGCITNAGCTGGSLIPFPNGRFQFTTPIVGSIQQTIPSIDTSVYSSNVTGYYSVAITYPNACKVESDKILIDTSIFNPKITSEMPDLVGSGKTIFSTDTAYLCLGSYVDLYSVAPFVAPPTWSYQWSLNGLPIVGATGYNHRADTVGLYTVEVTNSDGCKSTSNIITILEPTNPNVANPFITTSSDYFCAGGPNIILTTTPCTNCTYEWLTEDNTGLGNSDTSRYEITEARGYLVKKIDTLSGCAYVSPIIEIKDTTYPAPTLSYTGDVICSANPTILSVGACASCTYVWISEPITGTAIPDTVRTFQNTYQIDTSGKYRIFIEYSNSGCVSNISNTIPATFQTVNANIAPSSEVICNGAPVTISAFPDSALYCPGCTYQFLRDGVRMQVTNPTYEQEISLAGDYQVIVTNSEGCSDTSITPKIFTEINISTQIRQSAGKICNPTSSVILEVDSCAGCAYKWKVGNINLIGSQDTFYIATGYAAVETYTVEVSIPGSGCSVIDSVVLDSVEERTVFIEIDSSTFTPRSLASPTICGGSSVFLLDTCQTCIDSNYYQYQWYFNGNLISGASFESYQVDTPGTYYVSIVDTNNCMATSNSIAVQEFSVVPGFALDFAALGPAVPITYGTFNLDDHLLPVSLRSRGSYSSLTAGGAIFGDSINVGTAGSGFHFITYSYVDSNAFGKCVFSTYDTLEVLGAVAMDILNKKQNYLGIPASEACLYDTLTITLTNFTFVPNEVIFVAGGGNTITVPVSPSLTVFAGVYSGAFDVIVPAGARTGKITLSNGTSNYESPNFYVIQNPAVTIDLISTIQPICSNLDTAEFRGLPAGGSLSAHYVGMANNPNLMIDSLLLLDSVTGYSNGVQNVVMLYTYTPMYTGTTIACRDSVQDSLFVEIRDVRLDSVHYTPISLSQTSEALSNLTLITYPISARSYTHNYSGTYVLGNSLLASTIPSTTTTDSITYHINNGGCLNSSTDPIDIWPAPGLLDSIPTYLCSKDDTVFIQRNTDSLLVNYRGQTIYSNSLYTYNENNTQPIGDPTGLNVNYSDKLNLMEIMTSNGGIDSINFFPPNDTYYVVPANIIGGATTITVKFSYTRTSNFFLGNTLTSTENTNYVIAEVSKTFLIEDPSTVAINPVILADTIFCPINANSQFLGVPAGGQYYISGASIGYDSLINNIFNPINYTSGNSYGLTYVYTGQACVDSAYTGIYLPSPFTIEVVPNNGVGRYCKTSPNDTIFFRATPAITPIDTASAQFFIGGVQSATIFSPLQVGPAGDYNIRYVVSDIYGCPEEALDTFTIYPVPKLGISPIDSVFCLNNDTTVIHLSQIDTGGTVNVLTTWSGSGGIGYVQADTAEFTGVGIVGGGMSPGLTMPYFHPGIAGEGTHDIRYVYTDSNSCMDSLNFSITVLPLPKVALEASGAFPLDTFYCENDVVPLFGDPIGTGANSGYGSWVLDTFPNGNLVPPSFDSTTISFRPFVAGATPGIVREVLFYYYEDNNGCRDTATHTAYIRNFTTDPTIVGLPSVICAQDTNISIWADPNGGFDLDSLGWFTSDSITGFSQLGPTVNTDSTLFYPDSANVVFANANIILTFHYTDTSRSCFNSISDTAYVKALPYLTLSESFVSSSGGMDLLGATLFAPLDSFGYHHICETAPEIPIYAYNTTGTYVSGVLFKEYDHITPDTGTYDIALGRGVKSNNNPVLTAYGYVPSLAGYGLDTVRYSYTDTAGCSSSVDHYIFVDSLPDLSFAGISNYDSTLNRYIYCQADPDTPSILPAPTGVNWTMTFNGQNITSVPFNLLLDTLAVPGTYMNYPLKYYYVGQRYSDGGICADSLQDTIQVRPSPQLAWVNILDSYCMTDSLERFPLSATPYGGQFIDETNNYQVPAGIVGDSLFNPGAQAGKRDIVYYYLDTTSKCSDTIRHSIYVYNKPKINFNINGGCLGSQVEFIPTTAPYGLKNDMVAIDSISMVIWNFGDGVIDTFANSPLLDTLVIPSDTHTYASSGIFYPSLTVVNQGVCDTTFMRRIIISPKVTVYDTLAYFEPFDTRDNGWMQESSDTTSVNGIVQDSLWQWGVAQGSNINTVQQNNTVWGTRLANQPTTYKPGESAWVYSPCFDISSLDRPMIQLSLWRNAQKNVDGAVLQYHDNITNTWEVLGKHGKGINWYQNGYVVSAPGEQTNTPIGWTGNTVSWENARYRLDNVGNDLRNRTDVRFRIAFASSPSTLLGINDGFAFDSVKIGNRTRNVLTEHFSGAGYPGIDAIEDQLYYTIYNNLYGRDVSLIQYHINKYSVDLFNSFNSIDNNERKLLYGISDVDQVRIDGKSLVGKTSDLLSYPQLEYLDIESLKDPKFKLEFISTGPAIQYNGPNGSLTATVRITALQDLPLKQYALHVVLTEDSLLTATNHATMAVMRDMYPSNTGQSYAHGWTAGDTFNLDVTMTNVNAGSGYPINTSKLQLVAFVQNMGDDPKEVYQVETTRNLSVFHGPVDTLDVSVDHIEDHPGYEVTTLKLYPNPTKRLFNVEFEAALEADYEWKLIDVVGRVLKEGKVEEGTSLMQVETDNLSAGMYIFIVKNKTVYTQRKVIIRQY